LLLQEIKNRRSVFTVHVHLIHDGKSGLEAVFDVTADLRCSVRLLPLKRADGREGGREGGRERGRVRGKGERKGDVDKQINKSTDPKFCDDERGG